MSMAKAAEATRKYFVMPGQEGDPDGFYVMHDDDSSVEIRFSIYDEAQAACNRLNLLAVLEAIREPSEAMVWAAPGRPGQSTEGSMYAGIHRAMIDALIAEVKAQE